MGDNETLEDESLERALADLELLQAAYPDEVTTTTTTGTCTTTTTNADTTAGEKLVLCTSFPLQFTLTLSEHAGVTMELTAGYPTTTGVQIATYRSNKAHDKGRLEATVSAIRRVSLECQHDEIEGGFQCCSTALETWNDHLLVLNKSTVEEQEEDARNSLDTMEASALILQPTTTYEWVSSQEALEDKKSKFVAHLCRVHSEWQVREALHQLLSSSSKLQRASHNMYAWRVSEAMEDGRVVTKHDNDDDGEDAAGSKLAYLLDMRKDDNVLVVVSRWYGGTHLGPKRFAHIVNVARELLVQHLGEKVR